MMKRLSQQHHNAQFPSGRSKSLGLLGASVLAISLSSTSALAQQAASESATSNEIIVTAQRRAEALEKVPMSVEVVTAETMAATGVNSLRDISNVTTGVALNQGGAYPQPTIRGVTTVINGTYENNVAVYVDGLYQPSPQTLNIDLPNVANMQVLKGPQGTLYGRNATGGAILISTIMPGDTWEGKAEVTYARFDDKRASAYVAGPLSDKIGVSLAGYVRRSDGYMKMMSRTEPGETDGNAAPLKQDAIRAKLAADLTDNFRAVLSYSYVRVSDPRGNMFSPFENISPTYALTASRLPQKLGQAAYDIDTTIQTKQHEASLTLALDTDFGEIRSITGYTDLKARTSFDFDGSFLNNSWSTSLQHQKTIQQSVDVHVTEISGLDVILGASYFGDKVNFTVPNTFYSGLTPTSGAVEVPLDQYFKAFEAYYQQKKEAFALYADFTFKLAEPLSITVGGRYSAEDQDVSGYQTGFVTRPQTDTGANFRQFTPRANIRYDIGPRTSIYASYSKGFRSGNYNSQIPANNQPWLPARPETINAYEVGFKTAGSGLRLELAAFHYDYKDLQVSSTIIGPSGTVYVDVTNAPKARINGVEGSFEWEPITNLTIRGGATYLDAKYGKGFQLSTVGVNPSLAGLNSNADPLKESLNFSQIQNLAGQQMARAPKFAGNLGFDYLAELGFGSLRFAANAKYTDSYVVTNPAVWCDITSPSLNSATICAGVPEDRRGKQRFREGSYVLVNASLTYTDPSDHFYARVWANNITNHKYRLHYTGNAQFGSYSPMAEPRTYGITAGYKF